MDVFYAILSDIQLSIVSKSWNFICFDFMFLHEDYLFVIQIFEQSFKICYLSFYERVWISEFYENSQKYFKYLY